MFLFWTLFTILAVLAYPYPLALAVQDFAHLKFFAGYLAVIVLIFWLIHRRKAIFVVKGLAIILAIEILLITIAPTMYREADAFVIPFLTIVITITLSFTAILYILGKLLEENKIQIANALLALLLIGVGFFQYSEFQKKLAREKIQSLGQGLTRDITADAEFCLRLSKSSSAYPNRNDCLFAVIKNLTLLNGTKACEIHNGKKCFNLELDGRLSSKVQTTICEKFHHVDYEPGIRNSDAYVDCYRFASVRLTPEERLIECANAEERSVRNACRTADATETLTQGLCDAVELDERLQQRCYERLAEQEN